ncbi:kinase-like domain-containing protein [Schizophyllum commune]
MCKIGTQYSKELYHLFVVKQGGPYNDKEEEDKQALRHDRDPPFLPESLALWKALDSMKPCAITSAYLAWAYLADVFKHRGYGLYVPRKDTDTTFWTMVYPVNYIEKILPEGGKPDRNVVLGSRRYVVPLFPYPAIWAATNQSGDEFIIKVVSDGQDPKGLAELRILEHLDRPDLRAHPRNRTVPVVEFVRYEQYTFAIFPRWTDFPEKEIRTPRTAVECCVQVTDALAFLHEQCIAHLDISMENIMINFFGYVDPSLSPVVEYFPIACGLIDFGESVFLDARSSLAPPRDYAPRPTSAPEVSSGEPFDPFAADVYQTARFLLEQFYDLTGLDPEFLAILQAMTSTPPSSRISMAEAHKRFAALQTSWLRDPDADVIDIYGRRKNKYTDTYLNTWRPPPGMLSVPKDDEEARALRERMRQDRKEEYGRVLSFHGSGMLWVDHVPGTIGCVDGNNPRKPGF